MQLLHSLEHIKATLGLIWPYFNIYVSQGKRRAQGGEERWGMASWGSSQNTQHLLSWPAYMGTATSVSKQLQESIKDHRSSQQKY